MNRVGNVALLAATMTVSSWIFGPSNVPAPPRAPAASHSEAGTETLVSLIEAATDRFRAVPAVPGQRPPFIPSGATVVQGRTVVTVTLDTALAGRSGSVVAWIR